MNEGPTVEERVLETQIKRLQAEVASLQVQLQNNQEDMKLDLSGQIEETMCVLLDIQHRNVYYYSKALVVRYSYHVILNYESLSSYHECIFWD